MERKKFRILSNSKLQYFAVAVCVFSAVVLQFFGSPTKGLAEVSNILNSIGPLPLSLSFIILAVFILTLAKRNVMFLIIPIGIICILTWYNFILGRVVMSFQFTCLAATIIFFTAIRSKKIAGLLLLSLLIFQIFWTSIELRNMNVDFSIDFLLSGYFSYIIYLIVALILVVFSCEKITHTDSKRSRDQSMTPNVNDSFVSMSPAISQDDETLRKIKYLSELYNQGVLSGEEFAQKKKDLLDRL